MTTLFGGILIRQRIGWVDIAKGIGILAVILGHSSNQTLHHYVFWFHMPLFFALSGYFFKPVDSFSEFKGLAWKRIKQLLIPYVVYAVIFSIARFSYGVAQGTMGLKDIAYDIAKAIYGGQGMIGPLVAFWFITCLLLTQLAFTGLLLIGKRHRWIILPTLLVCYALAHLESMYFPLLAPLSADVVLMAITYFAIGYFSRSAFEKLTSTSLFPVLLIALSAALVILDLNGTITYELDMKPLFYQDYLLDLVIPLTFTSLVCLLSKWLERIPISRVLEYLGQCSLTIMYVHVPINLALQEFLHYSNWVAFSVIGLAGSLLAQLIVNRLKLIQIRIPGLDRRSIRPVD